MKSYDELDILIRRVKSLKHSCDVLSVTYMERLRDDYEYIQNQILEIKKNSAPHMCASGHPKIHHYDSEHEMCPLCIARALFKRANKEKRRLRRLQETNIAYKDK